METGETLGCAMAPIVGEIIVTDQGKLKPAQAFLSDFVWEYEVSSVSGGESSRVESNRVEAAS